MKLWFPLIVFSVFMQKMSSSGAHSAVPDSISSIRGRADPASPERGSSHPKQGLQPSQDNKNNKNKLFVTARIYSSEVPKQKTTNPSGKSSQARGATILNLLNQVIIDEGGISSTSDTNNENEIFMMKTTTQPKTKSYFTTTEATTHTPRTTIEDGEKPFNKNSPKIENEELECKCSKKEGNNDLKNKGIWDQFNPQTNKNKRDKTDVDKKHYELAEHISKHIFKNYPEYQMPLLAKHLMKGVEQRMYDGMVMELKQADSNFNILLTDSFSHTNYNGQSRTSEQYPSLYQCSKAIRYCSSDPTFCQYQEGDHGTKIILVAPHGGTVKPVNILERVPGCFINGECFYSREKCSDLKYDTKRCPIQTRPERKSKKMTSRLANSLKELTGFRPHVVIMNMHRTLVDADANRDEGAQSDITRSVWYDFHNFISLAKTKVNGRGLLLDIHSHMNMHGMVDLSYGTESSDIVSAKNQIIDIAQTSFRFLAERSKNQDFIRGLESLGGLLEKRHIEAFPSPNYPESTYSGFTENKQTIVKVYGSLYGGTIDAVKISVPKKYCARKQARVFIRILAESINEFMRNNSYMT